MGYGTIVWMSSEGNFVRTSTRSDRIGQPVPDGAKDLTSSVSGVSNETVDV